MAAAAMRVGVFGGTFDPPHVGHLIVATEAHRALELDRLLFVPAALPPHKGGGVHTSPRVRLEMVRRAIRGDQRFGAEDVEVRRAGPSYTIDTLRIFAERMPGAELFLLIGADNLRDFSAWREPRQIMSLARLVVLARAGEEGDGTVPAIRIPVTRIDVSSTAIRRRVGAGESIRYLVPEAVRRMVERHGLYQPSLSSTE
ncbi:MAG: nicotinate-nucleotide adenylyltransferase [Gemmatimonadota bacterium]|nr:nicotinate-nucleotide adenylyltransferase [Gemmatimonadota bacterium]